MNIWIVVAILLIISFFWSLFSLWKEQRSLKEVERVKKELVQEKILFQDSRNSDSKDHAHEKVEQ
jgi:hypothetical protein